MPNDKRLVKVAGAVSPGLFAYFQGDNILSVAEDKSQPPFAKIVCDENYPDHLILFIAIDYPNSINTAELALTLSSLYPIAMGEGFYYSAKDGGIHYGEEAFRQWNLESINLEDLESLSKELH